MTRDLNLPPWLPGTATRDLNLPRILSGATYTYWTRDLNLPRILSGATYTYRADAFIDSSISHIKRWRDLYLPENREVATYTYRTRDLYLPSFFLIKRAWYRNNRPVSCRHISLPSALAVSRLLSVSRLLATFISLMKSGLG